MIELMLKVSVLAVMDLQLFARGTVTQEAVEAHRREYDREDDITRYVTNEAPLTVILKKLTKEGITDPEFYWTEKDVPSRVDAINNVAGYDDAATDIVVDHASYFNVRDIIKNMRTDEQMIVTAINDANNTLTVRRGFGTTAAAAMLDNDTILRVATAHPESGNIAEITTAESTPIHNYAQLFKTSLGVSGTAMASTQRGVQKLAELRQDKSIEHALDIEYALWFGEPKLFNAGGEVARTTGGVMYFNKTNVVDAGGATTMSEVEYFTEVLFSEKEGSKKKVAFCGAPVITVIDQLFWGKVQVVPSEKFFGLEGVQSVRTSHGELVIVEHPLFVGNLASSMVALDMKYLKYRPLRDTDLKKNVQNPGQDAIIDQYLTEAGLQFKLPKMHGVMKNITSAA